MTDTSNSIEKSRWNRLAPYIALLFGALILLFVILHNQQDSTDKSRNTANSDHHFDSASTPAQPATTNTNAATSNVTPTPAASLPDPFKAFLEAHKNDPFPPSNNQARPKTPQEIQAVFKAAVEKDISSAYPFANVKNQKGSEGNP